MEDRKRKKKAEKEKERAAKGKGVVSGSRKAVALGSKKDKGDKWSWAESNEEDCEEGPSKKQKWDSVSQCPPVPIILTLYSADGASGSGLNVFRQNPRWDAIGHAPCAKSRRCAASRGPPRSPMGPSVMSWSRPSRSSQRPCKSRQS